MSETYTRRLQIRKVLIFVEALVVTAGIAIGQSGSTTTSVTATGPQGGFPKIETAPGFMYIHTGAILGFQNGLNCVGGGGTIAYNLTSALGVAADLGGCKILELNGATGPLSMINGSEFTYLFGPRITFRHGRFQPFGELSFGGTRVKVSCNNGDFGNNCGGLAPGQIPTRIVANPTGTSISKNAFSLSVGGGFDIKLNQKIAIRLVQAEYLYTRFGNDCPLAICSNNNSQNSFRLKSGIVLSWGHGGGAY
jgi:opacity protein-like surface antigen